jgi:hypothetical protein
VVTNWPNVAALDEDDDDDDDDCGVFGGMKYWQGKPKYSKKTATDTGKR